MRSTARDMGTQRIVMCPGKVHFCSTEGEGNFYGFKGNQVDSLISGWIKGLFYNIIIFDIIDKRQLIKDYW